MAGALKHGGAAGNEPDRSVDARTLGEWLEERLRQAEPASRAPLTADYAPAPEHRRIAEALERLAKRLEAQERRSASSSEALDHALADLRERLGAAEGLQADTADRLLRTFLSLERAQGTLSERIATLETDSVSAQTVSRLESRAQSLAAALEDHRAHVGRDVTELRDGMARLAQAAQDSLEELDSKLANAPFASREAMHALEREARSLRTALDRAQRDLQARLDGLEGQTARAAQHSDLTALSKQAAALAERQEAALSHLAARVEALAQGAATRADLDERSRQLAQALAERQEEDGRRQAQALAALAERQEESAQALRGRIETLRDQIVRPEDLEAKLAAVRAERAAPVAALETQLETLAARLPDTDALAHSARQVSADLAALSERFSTAELDRAKQAQAQDRRLSELRAWVEAAEGRAEAAAEAARETALQRYAELERLSQERIAAAERRSAEALDAFAAEQRALHARLEEVTQSRVEAEVSGLREELEARASALAERAEAAIDSARHELDARLASAIAGIETGAIASSLAQTVERVGAVEAGQKALAQDISVELRRWTEAIDKRLRGVDGRIVTEGQALQRLAERFERLESHAVEAAGDAREALLKLESRIEERAGLAERRAAQALEQVGAQIVELADRLDQRQRALLQDASERLETAERQAAANAAAFAEDIRRRLEALEAQAAGRTIPEDAALKVAPPPAVEAAAPVDEQAALVAALAEIEADAANEEAFAPALEAPTEAHIDGIEADQSSDLPLPAHLTEDLDLDQEAPVRPEPPRLGLSAVARSDQPVSGRPSLRRKSVAEALGAAEGSLAGRDLAALDGGETAPPHGDGAAADDALYVEDFDEAEGPRYDFVDALDAILNQASTPPPGAAPAPPPPLADPLLALEDQPAADQRAEKQDKLSLARPPEGKKAAPIGFGPPEDRPPPDPTELGEDLFDPPTPSKADAAPATAAPAASLASSREPSYLAAARRAAKERVEAATKPKKSNASSPLMRAILWGAAAVAVGSSIYALSRNEPDPPELPPEPAAEPEKTADLRSDAVRAAKRLMQTAADRIALDGDFQPRPVDLPGPDEEPAAVTFSGADTPLQDGDDSFAMRRAQPRG